MAIVMSSADRVGRFPSRDLGAALAQSLDLALNREDRILFADHGYGLSRICQDAHFNVLAVQISGKLHRDSAIPNRFGGSIFLRLARAPRSCQIVIATALMHGGVPRH